MKCISDFISRAKQSMHTANAEHVQFSMHDAHEQQQWLQTNEDGFERIKIMDKTSEISKEKNDETNEIRFCCRE